MSRRRDTGGRDAGKGKPLIPAVALPSRGVPRRLRVERDLREQLVGMVQRLRDPRVLGVIITRVELTDDLAFARIYVRAPLEGGPEPKVLVRALSSAVGHLRREVSQSMSLRKAPELRFMYDHGLEAAERVEELLEEIREEESRNRGPEGSPTD